MSPARHDGEEGARSSLDWATLVSVAASRTPEENERDLAFAVAADLFLHAQKLADTYYDQGNFAEALGWYRIGAHYLPPSSPPEEGGAALKVSAFLVGREAMALAQEYLRRRELVTAARWAGTAAAYGAPGGRDLLIEIETHLDAGIPSHRPTPEEARMITKTDTIRGETVTTAVDIDGYDVTVRVTVRGVTWISNARAAVRLGVATVWEAAIEGISWRMWSPRRPGSGGPYQWFVAWDVFGEGELLPGDFYAQEAMVVATKHIETRNRTVPEEGKRE